MKQRNRQTLLAALLLTASLLAATGCSSVPDIDLPPLPTVPAEGTASPKATPASSPSPTVMPSPTASPAPTATPEPTATVTPTETPSPAALSAASQYYETPELTLTGETLPYDMEQNNVVELHGTIDSSCGLITEVEAMLLDSAGEVVQRCCYYPAAESFSLAGTVNASLRFAVLAPDVYIYTLRAHAENGSAAADEYLIDHSFVVYSGVKPTPSPAPAESLTTDSGAAAPKVTYTVKLTSEASDAGVMWNYFVTQLDNPYGAAAILGNVSAESSCCPSRVQGDMSSGYSFSADYTALVDDGSVNRDSFVSSTPGKKYGHGYGLCQWSAERKGALYDLARERGTSVGDLSTQCVFIMQELENDYPELLETLKTTDNAASAARQFGYTFEQAGTMGSRADYAEDYLERFAG